MEQIIAPVPVQVAEQVAVLAAGPRHEHVRFARIDLRTSAVLDPAQFMAWRMPSDCPETPDTVFLSNSGPSGLHLSLCLPPAAVIQMANALLTDRERAQIRQASANTAPVGV